VNAPIDSPDFALEWCYRLGANPASLEPLLGGINNHVFRLNSGSRSFVLKTFPENRASRDKRFKAEVEFLRYAGAVAPRFVPQLLYADEAQFSMVLEYLEGDRFQEGTHPSPGDIDHAIQFMRLLNDDLTLARTFITVSAADGFLLLSEHLLNIRQRINSMSTEHLPQEFRAWAGSILGELWNLLECLQSETDRRISQGFCEDALHPQLRCISPSDFGFHNAIRTSEGLKFFDFEFAGWDDPIKAVIDFDLQPRVPIAERVYSLRKSLTINWNGLKRRFYASLPILKLKWACIILAPLNPTRWADKAMGNDALVSELHAKFLLAQPYLLKD
jgi:hypothetical protein